MAIKPAPTPFTKSPKDFKYGYAVNLAVEEGFNFGTFSPLPRNPRGNWTRVVGNGMADVAMYFTDKQVTDDPAERSQHFADIVDMLDGRKSFRQTQSIATKAKLDDAEMERVVTELIGNRASISEVNNALAAVENAVASAGGRLGSLV